MFSKAAEQKLTDVQFFLGVCYQYGDKVSKNIKVAEK